MTDTIQEVYRREILPLSESERLRLAALIIGDISSAHEVNGIETRNGGIRELFGSVSLGRPTGAANEDIDADLAREYGSSHERK